MPEGVADGIVLLLAAGVRARSGLGLGSDFGIGLPVALGAGELLSEFRLEAVAKPKFWVPSDVFSSFNVTFEERMKAPPDRASITLSSACLPSGAKVCKFAAM